MNIYKEGYIQLQCQSCNKYINSWYKGGGAPYNQWFLCEECVDKDIAEQESLDVDDD